MMRSEPLAYFITFRTYGSWLHGDGRGSVDRLHNTFSTPLVEPDDCRKSRERYLLKHKPVRLDATSRLIVRKSIMEVAEARDWTIHALEVRSNHVHVVVGAAETPERVMNMLKSWCTRRLHEAYVLPRDVKAWSRHGSTKYLWTANDLLAASRYTCEVQGADLAEQDSEQSAQSG